MTWPKVKGESNVCLHCTLFVAVVPVRNSIYVRAPADLLSEDRILAGTCGRLFREVPSGPARPVLSDVI